MDEITDLRQVTSFFDFIDVQLYDNPRYKLRDMTYYIWSEKNKEYQEYHTNEALKWEDLEEYVENKLVYVKR